MIRSLSFLTCATAIILLTLGCTTPGERPSSENESPVPKPPVAYEQKVEMYSAGEAEYAGFYNTFSYKATLLNNDVRTASLDRQASYYQWDADKISLERAKMQQELASYTAVFISFYTPERINDNLSDEKSIWKVYLDVGGRRYQGEVKRQRTLLAELQALYPYHTRWNTPYQIQFSVPTNAVETQTSVVTVTGPLGTKTVSIRSL